MDFGMDEPDMVFGPSPSVMARKKKARPPRPEMMYSNWKFPKPRGGNFDIQYTESLPQAFVDKWKAQGVPRWQLEDAYTASDETLQQNYEYAVNEIEMMPRHMQALGMSRDRYFAYRGWTQEYYDSLVQAKGVIEDVFGYRAQGFV